MLISRVPEDGAGGGEGHGREGGEAPNGENDSRVYRTASELFDLMARNHNFQPDEDENLTTRDLVLLYRNIDLGTKLMNTANEFKLRAPNQYVETIVYEDFDSDSDLSEIISSEDIHNLMLINKERIDLLKNPSSIENTLCHKLGDLEIRTSDFNIEFDRKFTFQDPFIKDQLKSLNLKQNSDTNNILPPSLLDYICCKRLEDNYTFYLDNIIRHVKHTIDQLKRISNGDYLTDRAKEKWLEVIDKAHQVKNTTKVLSNCTSIPLYVEGKTNGNATKWDDLVHSEVDIRSLSKILEKKIVVEVPKSICGSYKLFSKCCNDNLIISCTREQPTVIPEAMEESRVDLVLQLDRSDSGHVISNISSIMILQTKPENSTEALPLLYKDDDCINVPVETECNERKITVLELVEDQGFEDTIQLEDRFDMKIDTQSMVLIGSPRDSPKSRSRLSSPIPENPSSPGTQSSPSRLDSNSNKAKYSEDHQAFKSIGKDARFSLEESPPYFGNPESISTELEFTSSESNYSNRHSRSYSRGDEAIPVNAIKPDELRMTIQRLNMPACLQEEEFEEKASLNAPTKKKSPTRKIKSPYENKSQLIEEKKRKRLLEVRQRREKKKLALTDKLNKAKFTKGVVPPHTVSSITKLSITNKSFYDSIYGQPGSNELKSSKTKGCRDKKDSIAESLSENENDVNSLDQHANNRKFINKTFYLDETDTAMGLAESKDIIRTDDSQDQFSERSSLLSSDMNTDLKVITTLITPSARKIPTIETDSKPEHVPEFEKQVKNIKDNVRKADKSHKVKEYVTPSKTAGDNGKVVQEEDISKKNNTPAEFRKSIDKIYELINKLGKNEGTETKLFKSKFTAVTERANNMGCGETSTVHFSDSGTSVKQQLTSSTPSCCNFEKSTAPAAIRAKNTNKKSSTSAPSPTVVPKVIISSKIQNIPKIPEYKVPPEPFTPEVEKFKKERKKLSPPKFQSDNPLKAISQLLCEFDNVQKYRIKTTAPPESKETKKSDGKSVEFADTKNENRPTSNRMSKVDNPIQERVEKQTRTSMLRERRAKLPNLVGQSRFLSQSNNQELNKPAQKVLKKKVVDIVNEIKEARGEAVRGPSRPNARLNSLAQPKKTYVQAQIEEFQAKYGKSLVTDRLQRLTGSPPAPGTERNISSPKIKRRSGTDIEFSKSKHTPSPPLTALEETSKKPTISNSLENSPPVNDQSLKESNVSNTPDTLKNKMVAVESYVKNHYGRSSPNFKEPCNAQTTRVPFFPPNFDTLSLSLSSATDKLQNNRIFVSNTAVASGSLLPLTVLTECNEDTTEQDKNTSVSGSLVTYDDSLTNETDDSTRNANTRYENIIGDTIPEEIEDFAQPSIRQTGSMVEITKLENSIHRHMSIGAIQKCMKLKNMILPPKESLKQVLLLQSGDANSMLMKSPLSQSTKSLSDRPSGILPELSSWNFAQFPMQIATVGYTLTPHFEYNIPSNQKSSPNSTINDKLNDGEDSQETHSKSISVSSQCFKGGQTETMPESAVQVDVKEFITISSVLKFSSTVINENEELGLEQNLETDDIKNNFTSHLNTHDIEAVTEEDEQLENEGNLDKVKIKNNSSGNRKTCDIGAITEPLSQNDIATTVSQLSLEDAEKQKEASVQKQCLSLETPSIQCSTSLDVLVGLLNEIQKISSCQTQMTNSKAFLTSQDQRLELETILKSPSTLNKVKQEARNIISITSLDKLRQLESNPSIYSFYLSNCGDKDFLDKKLLNLQPVYADKEVDAIGPAREYVNRCTDVPSRFFPITVNHATDATESLMGILSAPSSQSELSYTEHPLHPNESLTSLKKIKKIIQISNRDSVFDIEVSDKKVVKKAQSKKAGAANTKKLLVVTSSKNTYRAFSSDLEPLMAANIDSDNMDSIMKMKRDILVTMYSVLVLTVFAALSFPEMLYRV